ncbi:hypothetical protein RNJ44_00832 [Nakaseomyces bracarensis]|uniref:Uncharacterized protein n=1 Tax=Nakaseomyces bracarensis TaxID=273131 RepID=A0ABR4NSG5_9SACH
MIPLLFNSDDSDKKPRCLDDSSRIMVIGDPKVGKTSMIIKWLTDSYENIDEDSYSDDIYRKRIQYYSAKDLSDNGVINERDVVDFNMDKAHRFQYTKKDHINVEILDANINDISEHYSDELRTLQVRQSDAVVICFDGKWHVSFDNLREYYTLIKDSLQGEENIPIVFCNTKIDYYMEDKVEFSEISNFLTELGLNYEQDYFETSSKHNINVKELIFSLLYRIEKNKERIRRKYESEINSKLVDKHLSGKHFDTVSNDTKIDELAESEFSEDNKSKTRFPTSLNENISPMKASNGEDYLDLDDLNIPSKFIDKTKQSTNIPEKGRHTSETSSIATPSEIQDGASVDKSSSFNPRFKTFSKLISSGPPKPIIQQKNQKIDPSALKANIKQKKQKSKKDKKLTPPFDSSNCIIS